MRERLSRFMAGRNGADALGRFFLWVALVFLIITLFSRKSLWYLLAVAALAYGYFRMMSRNVSKRYLENQKFLQATAGVRQIWAGWRQKASYRVSKMNYDHEQRRHYRIFQCPGCGQKLRIPKGRGKVMVTCSKCHKEFMKHT